MKSFPRDRAGLIILTDKAGKPYPAFLFFYVSLSSICEIQVRGEKEGCQNQPCLTGQYKYIFVEDEIDRHNYKGRNKRM